LSLGIDKTIWQLSCQYPGPLTLLGLIPAWQHPEVACLCSKVEISVVTVLGDRI